MRNLSLLVAVVVSPPRLPLPRIPGTPPPPAQGRGGPGYLKLFDSNLPCDPHDLAGIWSPNANGFGGGRRCRECGDRGYSFEFPVDPIRRLREVDNMQTTHLRTSGLAAAAALALWYHRGGSLAGESSV